MGESFYMFTLLMFLVMASFAFMPYWTRKTESFGVTIPQTIYGRNDLKKMRRTYTLILLAINLFLFTTLIISSFYASERVIVILFVAITLGYFLISFLIYLPFHIRMKRMKEREK